VLNVGLGREGQGFESTQLHPGQRPFPSHRGGRLHGHAIEAEERGLPRLEDEFAIPSELLLKALIYCAMTADVDGRAVEVEQRLDEILTRYGNGHVVDRPIRRSAPLLRTVGSVSQCFVDRVLALLGRYEAWESRSDRWNRRFDRQLGHQLGGEGVVGRSG
jgi:hypothetical protein